MDHDCHKHKKHVQMKKKMLLKLFEGKKSIQLKKDHKYMQHKNTVHTHSSRYISSSTRLESAFGLPLTISRATTPKANTSAFSVRCPRMAYSGARYPLYQ